MSGVDYPEQLTLQVGPVSAVDLALYAAASGDHNPLHLDEAVASAAGFERPLVHGMLTMAYVARLFSGRFGPYGLRSLQTRFVGAASRGEHLMLTAQLGGIEGECARYTVSARTEAGVDIVTGEAVVSLSAPSHVGAEEAEARA